MIDPNSTNTEAMQVLEPIVTGTIKWEVHVDTLGQFYADAAGLRQVQHDSYAKLTEVCKRHAAKFKVKVEIPYTRFRPTANGAEAVHGVAYGVHSTSGKVMTREEGKAEQYNGWSHDIYPPMPAEDEQRIIEIVNATSALERERRGILDQHKWEHGFSGTVTMAIEAKTRELVINAES